ncbi:hypothetical protein AVEN_253393-1 [Araneus ventricosus]|uniref:Uncharacterized protein n=1 Tax=Araneus ventricosus TaxID=182803 RepID=A0A4Y2VHA6_ARAVE|nr:hypothetical protein AVEN_253393-1 [Araneus ventricosus]
MMEFIPSDTRAFCDIILCEEERRRQVARKRKNTEHISDGKNKKVKIEETDKKKGVEKDKKSDKRRLESWQAYFQKNTLISRSVNLKLL